MNVLSLFGGMEVGCLALKDADVKFDRYFSSEIDKYAIQIAKKNHPEIEHIEGVEFVQAANLPKIDLLIGGSPCQGFSIAGRQLFFKDSRSRLFFEFVRLLGECNPKYFLLENVVMKKEIQDAISDLLRVQPIKINSALVSAQNRKRLYWTNIPNVEQPADKEIMLKDILETGVVDRDKSYCIDANYFKGGSLRNYLEKKRRQIVLTQSERRLCVIQAPRGFNKGGIKALSGKTPTLTGNSWEQNNKLLRNAQIRKLTPIECERLQTLPDNYTEGVSNTQRYKMIGNGWTVDVIAHIFKNLKGE